jgi:hypothetical protein
MEAKIDAILLAVEPKKDDKVLDVSIVGMKAGTRMRAQRLEKGRGNEGRDATDDFPDQQS